MAKTKKSQMNFQMALGDELKSRRIALCITGSVAAIKSPEIARELIRHGAEVISVMSEESQSLIQPTLMQWATQNDVITKLTGNMEHIRLIEKGPEKIDLLLIAPATANTISKIAIGVSDTIVTLLASSAIGSGIPIIVAPTMHNSLWSNPIIISNMNTLRKMNIHLLTPVIAEGKAKISPIEEIVNAAINCLTLKDMKGLNVFVTAGPTYEYIDPIRVVTNRSTGKMGFALAREAWRRGANVTLVSGPTMLTPPDSIDYSSITTTHELINTVKSKMKKKKYDIFLAAAAPSDFRPVKTSAEKMSSRITKPFDIQFDATEKVISIVKKIQHDIFLVSFKAEFNLNNSKIIERAKLVMHEVNADLVATNDVSQKGVGFEGNTNKILLLKKDETTVDIPLNSKQIVAHQILDVIIDIIRKHPQ